MQFSHTRRIYNGIGPEWPLYQTLKAEIQLVLRISLDRLWNELWSWIKQPDSDDDDALPLFNGESKKTSLILDDRHNQ